MDYKILVLVTMTVAFLYEVLLEFAAMRSIDNPIPENVSDVYDPESYQKWRSYKGEKYRLGLVGSVVAFAISLPLMALDAYATFASLFPKTTFVQTFAVVLLVTIANLATIPISYYDTMVIEERYGFNRTSKGTFWADQVKGALISLLLITVIASILMWAHQALGDLMIVAFAVAMTLLVLFLTFVYPIVSRIFNKFTPLEDGELKDRLTEMLERHGYHVRAVEVMDASRRTTKSNAYFTGFGKMKTIVIYDTMLGQMSADEICAVFAHEMGHGLHRDTLRNQALSFVQMLILGTLAWVTLRTPELHASFGFDSVNYGFALVLIMSVEFALVSPLYGLLTNYFLRKAELRADAQAVAEGYGKALISALKKLERENFGNLAPSPLLVVLEYSHPPLDQRIDAIEKEMSRPQGILQ